MATQKSARIQKVEGLLTELNRFSFGMWYLILMLIACLLLSKLIFHFFDVSHDFQFTYILASALCGVAVSWYYFYGRLLILRHRAKKLFRFVNRGNAWRVLHLGHELGFHPENGYGVYQSPILKKLVERCPAKEFAEFLCSLLYLKALEILEKKDDNHNKEDVIAQACMHISSTAMKKGLAECIVSLCEKSYHLSSRKYVSEFLDGLCSSRHLALANNFIQEINTVLEKKRNTRITRLLELKKSRTNIHIERRNTHEQKFFNKTVKSLIK